MKKYNKKQKIFFVAAMALLPFVFLLFLYWMTAWGVFGDLPSKREIQNISNPLASELYASNEKLIGKYYIENRSQLNIEDISPFYKNALIATEDHRFYKHKGVDYKSLVRVFIKTILLQNDKSGGGSTITQQLAKNLYPRKKYKLLSTVINKFREMHIAKDLERQYSKDEIIWLYSNTVSFGERAFGLASASKRFFNKSPKDLVIEEAATLVGVLKATSYYSPRKNPERAVLRRNTVLKLMAKHGYISNLALADLKKSQLKLDYQSEETDVGLAKYFRQYVSKEFKKLSNELRKDNGTKYNLFYDGLKVYTSLDYDLQVAAEKIVKSQMKYLQKSFEEDWKGYNEFGKGNKLIDSKILNHPEYINLKKKGLSSSECLKKFNIEKEYQFWNWDEIEEKKTTRIDSIKHALKLLHTGLLAVNPQNGQIKTWIGGNDYSYFQYDNITEPRQVGSLFKPIVYLTALEKGQTTCDLYKNELRTYKDYDDWTPKNASEEYGGYLSMNAGLTHSVNTISVQVLFDAGMDNVVEKAKQLGIESTIANVPSMVLGTSDISLLEMVGAYATISNNGHRIPVHSISRIEDKDGNLIYEKAPEQIQYTEEADSNYIALKRMMQSVTREGTASRIYQNYDLPFNVFGKTGTTQKQSDGWFIGCTNNLVVGSWIGTKDRRMHFRTIGKGSGGRTAMPIVGALLEFAGQKNLINREIQRYNYPSCPDYLTDEQYAFYQKNKDFFEDNQPVRISEEPEYGGWLKKLLGKRKIKKRGTLNDQYEEKKIRGELEKIKRERDERMRQYQRELQKWENKLKELEENR